MIHRLQFKPSSINRYYTQWKSPTTISIHQSNPQPFALGELEGIIGPLKKILDQDLTLTYATTQGNEQLRISITTLYDHDNPDQIATFTGAQEAIFCSIHSLLDPGDKVVAITPVFEPLVNTAENLGCEIKLIPLEAAKQWFLDLNKLEHIIKSGCKLLILNFPHNPTGAMITKDELLQIIKICDDHHCWILSDEVFRGLEYKPQDRLPAVSDLYPKAVSIGVLSKSFALPAIRIGWISCQDKSVIKKMLEVKDYLSICNSLIDERLTIKVMQHHDQIWERNRNLISENLVKLEKFMSDKNDFFTYIKPEAGCVCFPIIRSDISANDFAQQLSVDKNLLVLPADLFCTTQNGIRLGFGYKKNISYLATIDSF